MTLVSDEQLGYEAGVLVKTPIISVIIPCYNYGAYIQDAVESVLHQTFESYEIIIVDDGSTDPHTIEVLGEIERTYPAIKIVRQKNKHLSNARNTGIGISRGEFFVPLDADDTLAPNMLEKCYVKILQDKKIGVVYPYIHEFGNNGNHYYQNQEYNFYDLLFQNHLAVCSLVRKKAWKDVGGYDENMKDGYEDWEFWISIGERGWIGKVCKEYLFNYRKHGKSMIDDAQSKHDSIVKYIRNKHSKVYSEESLKKIKTLWKEIPHYSHPFRGKLEAAGVLDVKAWIYHPLKTLGRCVPIRIKEKINAKFKKNILDTSYYRISENRK